MWWIYFKIYSLYTYVFSWATFSSNRTYFFASYFSAIFLKLLLCAIFPALRYNLGYSVLIQLRISNVCVWEFLMKVIPEKRVGCKKLQNVLFSIFYTYTLYKQCPSEKYQIKMSHWTSSLSLIFRLQYRCIDIHITLFILTLNVPSQTENHEIQICSYTCNAPVENIFFERAFYELLCIWRIMRWVK